MIAGGPDCDSRFVNMPNRWELIANCVKQTGMEVQEVAKSYVAAWIIRREGRQK